MQRIVSKLLVAVLMASAAIEALASGRSETHRGSDLVITSSTEWCGCCWGGYFPIRMEIQNNSVERTVTLRFQSNSSYSPMPVCEKTLVIAQNATAKTTLSIPVVSSGTGGELTVYVDGNQVDGLKRSITLPDAGRYETPRPCLLAISSGNEVLDVFEAAYSASHYTGSVYGPSTEDNQLIDTSLLPESWIDYTGLDLVAITLDDFEGELSTGERTALLEWVDSGGNLVIHDIGGSPADSQRLESLLKLETRASASPEWIQPQSQLNSGSTGFYLREVMNGLVIAVPDHAFPTGDYSLWDDLLRSLRDERRLTWPQRMGMQATVPHPEFLHFLIPSIKSVPVMSFLVLITLFTIVIGPVNYFWLWKKSRLQLLVVTIPFVAIVTSFLLLGYSVVAHGFGVRSRMRSVTYLDQRSNEAVCVTRVSLYAGMAPRNGLNFSPDTAVFPVWPSSEIEPGHVNWTSTQHFDSGWLKSRTRTQFVTMTHRDERGRVDFAPVGDGLRATNGLEWELAAILVKGDDDTIYFGENVPAGGSTELTRADPDDFTRFSALLREHPVELPPNAPQRVYNDYDYRYSPYGPGYYGDYETYQSSFQLSITESMLMQFSVGRDSPEMGSRSYIAIVNGSPGCDIGIEGTSSEANLHVLFARY